MLETKLIKVLLGNNLVHRYLTGKNHKRVFESLLYRLCFQGKEKEFSFQTL